MLRVLGRAGCRGVQQLNKRHGAWRFLSASSSLIVENREGPIVRVTMNSGPVNTLTPQFLGELNEVISTLNADTRVKGMLLKSGRPKIFSAGLDLHTLATAERAEIVRYWRQVQELFIGLHGSRLATAAALEGHAVAGGCILAMLCDSRHMTDNGKIGLNDAQAFGLPPPPAWSDLMAYLVGERRAERYVSEGVLLSAEEALSAGLVDAVTHDPLNDALAALRRATSVDEATRLALKLRYRGPALERLQSTRDLDADQFASLVLAQPARTRIANYLADLKTNKKQEAPSTSPSPSSSSSSSSCHDADDDNKKKKVPASSCEKKAPTSCRGNDDTWLILIWMNTLWW